MIHRICNLTQAHDPKGWPVAGPRSGLDNQPLRDLLEARLPQGKVAAALDATIFTKGAGEIEVAEDQWVKVERNATTFRVLARSVHANGKDDDFGVYRAHVAIGTVAFASLWCNAQGQVTSTDFWPRLPSFVCGPRPGFQGTNQSVRTAKAPALGHRAHQAVASKKQVDDLLSERLPDSRILSDLESSKRSQGTGHTALPHQADPNIMARGFHTYAALDFEDHFRVLVALGPMSQTHGITHAKCGFASLWYDDRCNHLRTEYSKQIG